VLGQRVKHCAVKVLVTDLLKAENLEVGDALVELDATILTKCL
jgi:hypothetical protein